MKCQIWKKRYKTALRPNRARTGSELQKFKKYVKMGKNKKNNKTRTTPEPRPNHGGKPEERRDSKDATSFDIYPKTDIHKIELLDS